MRSNNYNNSWLFFNNYMLNISMHVDTEKTFEYVAYAVRIKIPCIRRI